jgi:methyl-accepting chemotaxis protein
MHLSIRFRVTATLIAALLAVSLIIFAVFHFNLGAFSQQSSQRTEAFIYQREKDELKDMVSLAYSTVEMFYQQSQDEERLKRVKQEELKKILDAVYTLARDYYERNRDVLPLQEIQEHVKDLVRGSRFDGGNYVWINDMHPNMVMHPIKPALDGKDLSGFKDPEGTYLFNEMVAVCKENGEGVVTYMWSKPGEEKPKPKISYVRLLPGLDWVFGTGAWLEDIEAQMQQQALEQVAKLRLEDGNYFWINDDRLPHPAMVMHPTVPSLNGQVLDAAKFNVATSMQAGLDGAVTATNGKKNLFQAMVEVVRKADSGQGYVTYVWPKPKEGGGATTELFPKLSFVRLFEPWGWVIGMGAYTDDIQAAVARENQAFRAAVARLMGMAAAISLACLAVIAAFMLFVLRRDLTRPLQQLVGFAGEVTSGRLDSSIHGRFSGELGALKQALESMVDSLKQEMVSSHDKEQEAQAQAAKAEEAVARVREHVISLNTLLDTMNTVAKKANEVSGEMASTAGSLNERFSQVSDGAQEQKQDLDQTLDAVHEMDATVMDMAQNAHRAAEGAEHARDKAREGSGVVNQAVDAIARVRELTTRLKGNMPSGRS